MILQRLGDNDGDGGDAGKDAALEVQCSRPNAQAIKLKGLRFCGYLQQ